ncbi:hypothetical protein L3Q82_020104 [Scortum barcoo]|uniref:Uncharacterized protein n=1 Tax=Scortum barcoo TaxID=214431 RepID=A0ACB8VDY6_9TELE|nr:hypothetical protein L3Q82_020104 [Scortum barcoo]
MSHREEAPGRPRTRWRDYVSQLAWERLGVPPEELEEVSGVREGSLGISAQTAASATRSRDTKRMKMDGWNFSALSDFHTFQKSNQHVQYQSPTPPLWQTNDFYFLL